MTDKPVIYGAYQEDWVALGKLNLPDLLPYVADPTLPLHPKTGMTEYGKTPSIVADNAGGFGVAGIMNWSNPKRVTVSTDDWSSDPRLGVCMRTRLIKAFDIDVEDVELAEQIEATIRDELGIAGLSIPVRYRENTGKRAMLFRLRDNPFLPLNRVPLGVDKDGETRGMIEILGDLQQLCMAGGHPKGGRYIWQDGTPDDIELVPELELAELIALRRKLIDLYGQKGWDVPMKTGGEYVERSRITDKFADDPVLKYLTKHDLVLTYSAHGGVYVKCPWEKYHGGDTKATDAEFFIEGTNGVGHYGFKCFHAHSGAPNGFSQPTHLDYLRAVGYSEEEIAEGFDLVPVTPDADRPEFTRNKAGRILPDVSNVTKMLGYEQGCGYVFCYDQFKDQIIYRRTSSKHWMELKDTTYTELRIHLANLGITGVGYELTRECVSYVAMMNTVNTATEWLRAQTWDGVERIKKVHQRVLGFKQDDEYAKQVMLYMFTALAGRVMQPGVKADMVPILIGAQGIRKSSFVEALAPTPNEFGKVTLDTRDTDLARQMRGKTVIEWDELRGLNSREAEAIKSWVTRTKDEWVPKFKEFATTYRRQFIMIGTSNESRIFNDPTGSRRWLPLEIERDIDVDYLITNNQQLWAEAKVLFERHGVMWQDVEVLARARTKKNLVRDPWVDPLEQHFETYGWFNRYAPAELMTRALGIPPSSVSIANYQRLQRALSFMGFIEKFDGYFEYEIA